MSRHYLVDTNVILRFLSGQPAAQAQAARALFDQAAAGRITLEFSPVVVAEAMYTLTSFYEVDRPEAAGKLLALLRRRGVKVRDADGVLGALVRLQGANVGFADAFLAATGAAEQIAVASFDRDLDRFKDVTRFEPKG